MLGYEPGFSLAIKPGSHQLVTENEGDLPVEPFPLRDLGQFH